MDRQKNMKSVIITGATGFIGRWLVNELLMNNVDVTILVSNHINRLPEYITKQVRIIKYDPKQIHLVVYQLEKSYDVFYNLGWGGVSPEQKNNLQLQIDNVMFSIDAVKFSKEVGCRLFIGIGTVAEYLNSNGLINGQQEPSPGDIYGAAKVSSHYMCKVVAKNIGQNFIWTILSSTFGEGRTDNNIITYTIRSLLNKEIPRFTKLEQMWDFLYVRDTARALYLIGEKGISGNTYSVGSGVYRPLYEYINIIRNCIDAELPLGIGVIPYEDGIIPRSCVDNRQLAKDTGFTPHFSFEEGIINTIRYFKEFV